MRPCACRELHHPRWVVLTGGPGGGKTALLGLIRQSFCERVRILPEAATILFGGGFPRGDSAGERRAAQRAIYHVQRELERAAVDQGAAVVLCDRGTVDGAVYWPGPGDLWSEVGTTLDDELRRYNAIIHLRTPSLREGYNQQNPVRTESVRDAAAIDEAIALAWANHPRRVVIDCAQDFLAKAARALRAIRAELPECCKAHVVPELTVYES